MGKCVWVWLAVALCFLIVLPASATMTATRFSVTNGGQQSNGGSWWPTIDQAGRFVAFHSWADNLGPVDRNFKFDIYVRDRIFGYNHLLSTTALGKPADEQSVYPSISGDGYHVVFCSTATNLVPGAANGLQQVYISDWQLGSKARVSVSTSGEEANADCVWPTVSGDGRYVAFESAATNLVPGAPGLPAVYLRDRLLGTTQCVSLTSTGNFPPGGSYKPVLSPSGRYLAFISWSKLIPSDTNLTRDVYLLDRDTNHLEVVSVADGTGALGLAQCGGCRPALSPDGRFVAFTSEADNLVANDTNGFIDVFVRDRLSGTTDRVSVSSAGVEGNNDSGGDSYTLGLNANGRFVVFSSLADNLVPDDHNAIWDAFRFDRVSRTIARMSVSPEGEEGNLLSAFYGIGIDASGEFTIWDTHATNLVPIDTNKCMDLYLYSSSTLSDTPLAVINGDEPLAKSLGATLSVFPANCTEVRFRNESEAWSPWEPALTSKAWPLSPGDGLKQVSIQGRHADLSESPETTDTIVLDTASPTGVTLQINGGAPVADTRNVTLSIVAEGAAAMRLRNSDGEWGQWEALAPTKDWQLSFGDGLEQVTLETRDEAGNLAAAVTAEIELQSTPPGAVNFTINNDASYTNSAEVTLTLMPGEPVEVRFRNETGEWSDWTAFASTISWTLSDGDGLKQVFAQGRDAEQNESAETSDDITLDATPPADLGLLVNAGAAVTASRDVLLSLAGTEVSEVRFRNQGEDWSAWEEFSANRSWQLSEGDGAKRISVQGRDLALNETEEITADIVLDTTPPTPSISINGGAASTSQQTVTLSLLLGEAVQIRLRNETGGWTDWQAAVSSLSWTLSDGEGGKQVFLEARDEAGNVSSEVSAAIVFDSTPSGDLALLINGGAAFATNGNVTLELSGTDVYQVRFRNEDEEWTPWEAFAATRAWQLVPGDGLKHVSVQGRDPALNETTAISATVVLDTTPPTGLGVSINEGAASVNVRDVNLSLSLEDATELRLRNETGAWTGWQAASATLPWTLTSGEGSKQVFLQGRDAAGNVSDEVSATVLLDMTAPTGVTLLINSGSTQTLARNVVLTIEASEAAQMRFCNENGDWCVWEAFSNSKVWTLSSGRAAKTISVQCRDAAGNETAPVSAAITWAGFTDVPSDYWDYEQIMACVDAGVVSGYEGGTYVPGGEVTRDQMAVFVARAVAGGKTSVPDYEGAPSFADVPSDYWAFDEIEYCRAHDIVAGYSDGYRPGDSVDRAQMAVFISRAVAGGEEEMKEYTPPSIASFADVGTGFWAYAYVEYCHAEGIVQGYSDGYHPDGLVTRDQMAAFIARAFDFEME